MQPQALYLRIVEVPQASGPPVLLYETINGNIVPPISELLNLVDWDNLSSGIPTRFHGDLHFENILISETGNFSLLDWRQDFAGLQEYGDLYYDLAKLLHGMIRVV